MAGVVQIAVRDPNDPNNPRLLDSTDGSAHVYIKNSDVQEVPVETLQDFDTITANAAANYDVTGLAWCDEVTFIVAGITSDTITPQISTDGATFAAVEPIVLSTRQGLAGTACGNGIFRIEMNGKTLRFVSSGTESKTVAWSAKSTGRTMSIS